jgi:hypothetical protein
MSIDLPEYFLIFRFHMSILTIILAYAHHYSEHFEIIFFGGQRRTLGCARARRASAAALRQSNPNASAIARVRPRLSIRRPVPDEAGLLCKAQTRRSTKT